MAFSKAKTLTTLLTASLLVGVWGCGTAASNNDQGTSVTATGFENEMQEGVSAVSAPLSTDVSIGDFAPYDGQTIFVNMVIQNNLTSQFVRLDRIDCSYTIPGSSVDIPPDSFAMGSVIQPNGSTGSSAFAIVSPDIYAFFNANRNNLPELPFRAIATCFGVVVTQAGDVLFTNSLNLTILFGDIAECCTGNDDENPASLSGGFQQGSGSGGDLNTFGGSGAAAGATADGATADGDTE